jgi:RNA polymerase sigma-70 factor (ECF subfamily)
VNEPAGDQEEQLSGLARRAGEGDESAFVRLVQRLEHRIRHWAGSLSDDADSADDLAQLTLIRMHERVAQFDSRSRLTSWLYGMMRNLAADRRRADWRRTVREQRAASELMVTAAACDADGARDERLALLLASYHTVLTSREREVFELVDLHGTPAAEAAARLHIVPSTARVLLLRARRKVRLLMLRDAENIEGDSR